MILTVPYNHDKLREFLEGISRPSCEWARGYRTVPKASAGHHLMDLQMQETNGIDAILAIRQEAAGALDGGGASRLDRAARCAVTQE